MFGPIIHARSSIVGQPDDRPLDFVADWPEDKERQEAERRANPPPPMTDEELEEFMELGRMRSEWELKNKRRWGY